MKKILIVLLLGFAVFCGIGTITDSFSFMKGGPDGQDHSIGNTLWLVAAFASAIAAGLVDYFFSKKEVV